MLQDGFYRTWAKIDGFNTKDLIFIVQVNIPARNTLQVVDMWRYSRDLFFKAKVGLKYKHFHNCKRRIKNRIYFLLRVHLQENSFHQSGLPSLHIGSSTHF